MIIVDYPPAPLKQTSIASNLYKELSAVFNFAAKEAAK